MHDARLRQTDLFHDTEWICVYSLPVMVYAGLHMNIRLMSNQRTRRKKQLSRMISWFNMLRNNSQPNCSQSLDLGVLHSSNSFLFWLMTIWDEWELYNLWTLWCHTVHTGLRIVSCDFIRALNNNTKNHDYVFFR